MNWRHLIQRTAVFFLTVVLGAPAFARQGSDPLAELNASVLVPGTKDAAEVLFPALMKMDPSPGGIVSLRAVSLMTPKSRDWGAWEAWAKAEPQQAVLEALKTVTDPKSKYLLGLRFGRSESKPEWVEAGLYVDLGDPPLIALASKGMHYFDRLDAMSRLCTVEAERLASEKKPSECSALLVNWLRFARIIADRPFAMEKAWAINQADAALERLGDLACSHPGLFDEKTVQETNRELDPRAIASERVRFPIGERLALRQLIALTIEERGQPRPDAFGPTMGRLTMDSANPFDLFPESAWWDEIGRQHAGWFDVREQADKVLNDWKKRWELNNIFDPLMQTPTDYSKMDRLKYAMIARVVDGMQELFALRSQVVTTLGGTRSALAVVGFKVVQGQWPPNLYAVQPRFVQTLDNDPWYFERERKVRSNYRYFVPMRDQTVGPRELPKPHTVVVSLDQSLDTAMAPDASGVGTGAAMLKGFALAPLAEIARDVVDSGGAVDAATLREKWLPLAKQSARQDWTAMKEHIGSMSDVEKEAFQEFQRGFAAASPKEAGEIVGRAAELPMNRPSLEQAAAGFGLTFDEIREFLVKANAAIMSQPICKQVQTRLAEARLPTDEEVDQMAEEVIGVLTRDDLMNNYVRKMLVHLAGSAGKVTEGRTLTAQLTDSDFVIYSVGPDMKADWAKNVGRAGPDILIWPPILTLERRASSGN